MKTSPNSVQWSDLPFDILRLVFEHLKFVDFHRAKIVCKIWYLCSKQTLHKKTGSPWLMLFPKDGCVLYNQDEDRVYKAKRNFPAGTRVLANSGNLFLTLDSVSNLYILDVFTQNRINLPLLESIKSNSCSLKRKGDKEFADIYTIGYHSISYSMKSVDHLTGLLWVDDKNKEEYTVVWFLGKYAEYIAFCKNGDDHYRIISIRGMYDMVLRGDILHLSTRAMSSRPFIKVLDLDLSGHGDFNNVKYTDILLPSGDDGEITYEGACSIYYNIAVTSSGELLLVKSIVYNKRHRISFQLYKNVPNPTGFVKVDSLGDEALLMDLGITVPADHTLGIEPNSIYFTRHDRLRNCELKSSCRPRDISVFNLETKNITRFPSLFHLKSKDARWFLPY